jgi:hypothetical protein
MSTPSTAPSETRSTAKTPRSVLRIVVCIALFSTVAIIEAVRLTSVTDIYIWLHLRTGLWILRNHSLPHTILFSQATGLPWAVPDWGFDLALGTLYKLVGLRAVPVMFMIGKVFIALALFLLAKANRFDFWPAVTISAVAQYALISVPSRPLVFGVVLFAFELLILFHARRTGDTRALLFLVPLFLVWANSDWHCCIGLFALLLFFGANAGERFWPVMRSLAEPNVSFVNLTHLGLITVLSAVATFLSPYSYHLFEVAYAQTFSPVAVGHFPDLRAIPFRHPQDFVTILLTMAAFFSLGRRHSRDIFKFALLAICAFIGFRFQRETWMIVVASVGIIGDALAMDAATRIRNPRWPRLVTAACVVVAVGFAASRIPASGELLNHAADALPVRACEFIRMNHLPGPIFNTIEWGDFLTWELPEYPVAIDTRLDAYREWSSLYFAVIEGEAPLETDSAFVGAQAILLDTNSALAKALINFPNFKVVYQDNLATVFVRQ